MDIIKEKIKTDIYIPNMLKEKLTGKNICFLDIETTGLSSQYNEVILIGLLCIENEEISITQFFAENVGEECELLNSFSEFLNKFSYIITYNGNTFDLPFLKKRLAYHKINHNIDEKSHLDLLRLVRKNKKILKLKNCKLKTVERSLDIYREDTISGKESVDLYKSYEYTKDKSKKNIILKHNYDDIFYLPQLLYIYDLVEKETILKLKTTFKSQPLSLLIDKDNLIFKNQTLSIRAKIQENKFPDQIYFKDNYSLNLDTSNRLLNVDIKYKTAHLSTGEECFYIDISEFNITLENFNRINNNIPLNLLLFKVNDQVVYENIIILLSKMLSIID